MSVNSVSHSTTVTNSNGTRTSSSSNSNQVFDSKEEIVEDDFLRNTNNTEYQNKIAEAKSKKEQLLDKIDQYEILKTNYKNKLSDSSLSDKQKETYSKNLETVNSRITAFKQQIIDLNKEIANLANALNNSQKNSTSDKIYNDINVGNYNAEIGDKLSDEANSIYSSTLTADGSHSTLRCDQVVNGAITNLYGNRIKGGSVAEMGDNMSKSNKWQEITANLSNIPEDLSKLPAGCVLIYSPYNSTDPKTGEGGHMALTNGDGTTTSNYIEGDGCDWGPSWYTKQGATIRVFVPTGK